MPNYRHGGSSKEEYMQFKRRKYLVYDSSENREDVGNKMKHYIEYCRGCRIVMGQCRCPAEKKTVKYSLCTDCKNGPYASQDYELLDYEALSDKYKAQTLYLQRVRRMLASAQALLIEHGIIQEGSNED